MLIHSDNLKILSVASTEEGRYALKGIHVDKDKGRVYATDGKCLVEMNLPDQELEKDFPNVLNIGDKDPATSFLIPSNIVMALQKSFRENSKPALPILKYAQIKTNDKGTFVGTTNLETNHISKLPEDIQGPDIDKVYPKEDDKVFEITINKEVLQNVLDALPDESDIDFSFFGNKRPVVFNVKVGDNKYKGALMPIDPTK